MSKHPFPIKVIALQAGLSTATVDRVLNGRGGVRHSTVRQVELAIADLERQDTQFGLGGRTFHVDLVMQSPVRFSSAVRAAIEAELPGLRPAVVRVRFHLTETGAPEEMCEVLDAIGRRGSHGVILKAADTPDTTGAVAALAAAEIPVVTLVTDIPNSARIAYVGIDNRASGATAAYLCGQWLGDEPATVLLTLSSDQFRGEEEREIVFRSTLRAEHPHLRVVELAHTDGLDDTIEAATAGELARDPSIVAVYSPGGGNLGIIRAFDAAGRPRRVHVAHDLDHDNTWLLKQRKLSAVLHHDLRVDLRRACQCIMQAHRALPGTPTTQLSAVQVITPHNLPSGSGALG